MAYNTAHTKTSGEVLEYKDKDNIVANQEMNEECKQAFQELKLRKKHRYIVFKMGVEYFEIESLGERNEDFNSFKTKLPYTDCRFAVYDHEYRTADNRPQSKLWFISWFPNNSTPYHKMGYTTSKSHFRETLTGVFDTQASSIEELAVLLGPPAEEEPTEDFDF